MAGLGQPPLGIAPTDRGNVGAGRTQDKVTIIATLKLAPLAGMARSYELTDDLLLQRKLR